ncbi:MAG: tetrahydromethanopterin S-methyltransferase subunit H [Methermicoccaceae archaeon]
MFRFKKEQIVHSIRRTKVGGQPGEYPMVLCGSIFYEGHSLVEDAVKGYFNHEKAESLISAQDSMADETGNPPMVHLYARTNEAVERYMCFASEVSDAPLVVDSTEASVRGHAAIYSTEVGLADAVVYNSLNVGATEQELADLQESDVRAAIVLAFNPVDTSYNGRMSVLEEGGGVLEKGLLKIAEGCDVKKILVDTAATSMGAGSGAALRATLTVKARYGLPTGSGIHNVANSWKWLKDKKSKDSSIYRACDSATVGMQQMVGGDYVLYGPIENARYAFSVAALGDILLSEAVDEYVSIGPDHPRNKLL